MPRIHCTILLRLLFQQLACAMFAGEKGYRYIPQKNTTLASGWL
jgi:hypothetical protein